MVEWNGGIANSAKRYDVYWQWVNLKMQAWLLSGIIIVFTLNNAPPWRKHYFWFSNTHTVIFVAIVYPLHKK